MKLHELKALLQANPDKRLNIIFPDADPIEPDFHITEVGHVSKNFIDCGGTRRRTESCVLQTWVAANDPDHRLAAGKLATILNLAGDLLPHDDLDVEIEYEGCTVSIYPVASAEVSTDEVRLQLTGKHTDCLAKEACGLEAGGCC